MLVAHHHSLSLYRADFLAALGGLKVRYTASTNIEVVQGPLVEP
jgi:hypothetical protein